MLKVPLRTLDTLWDREQDAGYKRLAIVRLLEDGDTLAKTGAGVNKSVKML